MSYISLLVDFVFSNPAVASAWATIGAGAVALLVGIATLIYLVRYTRRTAELRDEARRQTKIQSDAYEASVMPLLVVEFDSWQEGRKPLTAAVLIRNLGRGPALGVQVKPILIADCEVRFDYIPIVECGGVKPLVCVRDTPVPEGYPAEQQRADSMTARDPRDHNASQFLHRYARLYVLKHDSSFGEIGITTRSLSNTLHEFRFSVELRGSDDFAVLVYKGKTSRPGSDEVSAPGSTVGP